MFPGCVPLLEKMLNLYLLAVLLFVSSWLLDFSFLPRRPPIVNYDATEFFDPMKLQFPTSEVQISKLVKEALSKGQKVRVLGSGHSRNSLAYSDDVIISLHNYRGVIHLEERSKQVTVLGGTTLEELSEWLEHRGLALSVLPAILGQTIAGAISTATHGSNKDYGNLATLVTKIKMVDGRGEVVTLSNQDDNLSHFKAAQVSLGLLGVIAEVTLQCVDAFWLEETTEMSNISRCLEDLKELSASGEHVKLWLEMYSGHCLIFRYSRTDKRTPVSHQLWKFAVKMYLWEPLLWISSSLTSHAPAILDGAMTYGGIFSSAYSQVGRSYQLLAYPLYVPENAQAEVAVAEEECVEAVKLIQEQTAKWTPPVMFTEIRFVKEDDIWLSMDYGRATCHLTSILYNPPRHVMEGYFNSIIASLRAANMSPRLHMGKYLGNVALAMEYPRFTDFAAVRNEMDPARIFLNKLMASQF